MQTSSKYPLVGKKVKITGVNSRSELNGQVGRARDFNEKTERYAVEISSTGEVVSLRPANLKEVEMTEAEKRKEEHRQKEEEKKKEEDKKKKEAEKKTEGDKKKDPEKGEASKKEEPKVPKTGYHRLEPAAKWVYTNPCGTIELICGIIALVAAGCAPEESLVFDLRYFSLVPPAVVLLVSLVLWVKPRWFLYKLDDLDTKPSKPLSTYVRALGASNVISSSVILLCLIFGLESKHAFQLAALYTAGFCFILAVPGSPEFEKVFGFNQRPLRILMPPVAIMLCLAVVPGVYDPDPFVCPPGMLCIPLNNTNTTL